MKTNNGKRLIAAIAIFAMLACVFAIAIPSDDVSGYTPETAVEGTELTAADAEIAVDGATYYVNETATVSIGAEVTTGATLVLGPQAKVTMPDTVTPTITIKTGTFDEATKKITSYAGLTFTATADNVFTANSNYGIVVDESITATAFGISIKASAEDDVTYYPNGADIDKCTLAEEGEVVVKNGSITVTSDYTETDKKSTTVVFDTALSEDGVTLANSGTTAPTLSGALTGAGI